MITTVPKTKEDLEAIYADYHAVYTYALAIDDPRELQKSLNEVDRLEKLMEQADCWLDDDNEFVKEEAND